MTKNTIETITNYFHAFKSFQNDNVPVLILKDQN